MSNGNAIQVGTSPAGVQWNIYPRAGESSAEVQARVERMSARLAALHERHARRTAEVRLTDAQAEEVADEVERTGAAVEWRTRRTLAAPRAVLADLAEGLALRLDEDHAYYIEGGANKDLTEAQVAFGVRQREKCINNAIEKIARAAK